MRYIKLTHVGFRAHVNIASRIVSYRTPRLFVHELRVITVPIDYHRKCVLGHCACAESRDPPCTRTAQGQKVKDRRHKVTHKKFAQSRALALVTTTVQGQKVKGQGHQVT